MDRRKPRSSIWDLLRRRSSRGVPIAEPAPTRTLQALVALGLLVAVFLLAPGLGEVRDLLVKAEPGWLVVGLVLEGLSFLSYLVMFGPIFCTGLTQSRSWQIGGSELAMGSLVPASGAGGLALGAWVLHRGGHGRGADRPALGRLLPDQERGELPRGGRPREPCSRSGCSALTYRSG